MDEQSLPLFDSEPFRPLRERGGPSRPKPDAHLKAVRRLCVDVRRARHRSPQQTRAGQLICRHLIALLQDGSVNGRLDGRTAGPLDGRKAGQEESRIRAPQLRDA